MDAPAILRMPDVVALVGVSRMTIIRWYQAGTFPRPVQLGVRSIGWHRDDVDHWLETRPKVPSSKDRE